MTWLGKLRGSIISLAPLLAPFTSWMYMRKFSRKIVIRFLILISITPVIGFFRRPYVIKQFGEQLQHQIQSKQTEMKQSLSDANLDFQSQDNNFQYMILIRSERQLEDEELFEKQKALFELNNEILAKQAENDNYFDGIKFLFMGEEKVYLGLEQNLTNKDNNNFDYIKKQAKQGGMSLPKPDTIQLIAKQANGDNKIIMEWGFEKDITLKAIIRQISKHKHRKFVQSMNF